MFTVTLAKHLVPNDVIVLANRVELTVTDVYYPDAIRTASKLVVEADALSGESKKLVVLPTTRFTVKIGG